MHKQSEVQRIEKTLTDLSGEALMGKFRASVRGDVKLACALRGYFAEGDERYLPYLKSRIRPAGTELVLAGQASELDALDRLGLITPALLEEWLEISIGAHVPESIVWLLKTKERKFGFSGRERTL